jgi:hypothetical protein
MNKERNWATRIATKDQVIDAKHDLKQDERAQSEPTRRISNPFHPLA